MKYNKMRKLYKNGILWCPKAGQKDTLEMSGGDVSSIVTYGADENGELYLTRELRFPRLRTVPKDTHATFGSHYDNGVRQHFFSGFEPIAEFPDEIYFDGVLRVLSHDKNKKFEIKRTLFPDYESRLYFEICEIKNISGSAAKLCCSKIELLERVKGADGILHAVCRCDGLEKTLNNGESAVSTLVFFAGHKEESLPQYDEMKSLDCREKFIDEVTRGALVLETGNKTLDRFFSLAKLRASESIFNTEAGALHSPGGGTYYAAVWTNDQAEYAAPFFPSLGYKKAIEASFNMFSLYRRFMDDDLQPIPSSIIDEGRDIWEGVGDRGDAAMYLYGLSRFLLWLGDEKKAKEFFPAIDWCISFCRSKINSYGVIASDSDELEGRFPSGDANLCTSCLTYGGLVCAARLASELHNSSKASEYSDLAKSLAKSIESFFGYNVSGYETYRYYSGNDKLRSWICIPLTVGIYDRAEETCNALLSKRLMSENGLVCIEGDTTYWDRSTLYALRGIFACGESDKAYDFLEYYSAKRLLGEHVPYPVEAFPEGNGRHLSAESALFARVITEGMAGLSPNGFHSLRVTPSLPEKLPHITLKRIHACKSVFDIEIKKDAHDYIITVREDKKSEKIYKVKERESVVIPLSGE